LTVRLLPNPRHRDLVGLLLRLVLGGVVLVAGALKVGQLETSARAVRAYQLLPFDVAGLVGYGLPVLEIAVGLMLVLGLFTRVNAVVAGLLMLAFIIGISSAWARGLSIDCGCFGNGGAIGAAQTRYPQEIARDVGLLLCAVWLAIRPHSAYNLDGVLFPAAAPARPEPHEGHRA
jgi:uncharacterized membrane protein YphA (DoxX/SURF4 family)